jgi:hypothetical protein
MTLRCPVCRADNSAPPACRRCKADLSMLWTVEAERADRLRRAAAAVRTGMLDEAVEELDMAEELRQGDDVRRLRACVHLLAGDYEAALDGYQTTKRER